MIHGDQGVGVAITEDTQPECEHLALHAFRVGRMALLVQNRTQTVHHGHCVQIIGAEAARADGQRLAQQILRFPVMPAPVQRPGQGSLGLQRVGVFRAQLPFPDCLRLPV